LPPPLTGFQQVDHSTAVYRRNHSCNSKCSYVYNWESWDSAVCVMYLGMREQVLHDEWRRYLTTNNRAWTATEILYAYCYIVLKASNKLNTFQQWTTYTYSRRA